MGDVQVPVQLLVVTSLAAALLAACIFLAYQLFWAAPSSRALSPGPAFYDKHAYHKPAGDTLRQLALRVDGVPVTTSAADLTIDLQSIIAASPYLHGRADCLFVRPVVPVDHARACAIVTFQTLLSDEKLLAYLHFASRAFPYCYQDALQHEAVATPPLPSTATDNMISPAARIGQLYNQDGSVFNGHFDLKAGASVQQGNIINNNNVQDTAERCLADLRSTVTDPRHDKMRIQGPQEGFLQESCLWILDNPNFCQWRDNGDGERLLWIKGDPGKGKTMLLCGIIDQLEADPTQESLLSYCFCQATDDRTNTARAILGSLIYMLLDQDRSLISHAKKKYDTARKALFEDRNAWEALCEIFTDVIKDPSLPGVCLVVDALDECVDEDLPKLIDLVVRTSESTRAKWLVSSRNWSHIGQRLGNAAQRLSLEDNATYVAAAVKSYIKRKVDEIAPRQKYSDEIKSQVSRHLSSNANGTFLWVALVCRELDKDGVFGWKAKKTVKSFPSELTPLYRRMMTRISKSEDANTCRKVLALVATAYRPLSLAESTVLIEEWQAEEDPLQCARDIIGICSSLLAVRGDTVYFVHQSAKDFLMGYQHENLFPKGQAAVHNRIFSNSIDAMTQVLKRDIYGLHDPGFPIEDAPRWRPDPDPLAEVRYCCIYWVNHLIEASKAPGIGDDSIQDDTVVHNFLKSKGLYWIEATSLLGSMSEAMLALDRLLRHLQLSPPEPSRLQAVVKDAYRFLQSFRTAIESWPLQTYTSALFFSPTKSIMRELFNHEDPQWIKRRAELAEHWSACEATLEGHEGAVRAAAFSPDGRRVVSASDDKTVKLWNSATGECEATLKGHKGIVESAAFSPNGQQIISAAWDRAVKLWDVATGVCEVTLEGHTKDVWSACLGDGHRVVSASFDKTVRIWNAATGKCEATLIGHKGPVRSAALSPDGQRIVSASRDTTIKLWDAQTGKCEATLEGHTHDINSVAFSPDGQRIVSASLDTNVKLWNAATGLCEVTLDGHTAFARSAAFSPDGKRLVTGSDDGTVKLWDIATGTCLATLKGHMSYVYSTAFSADGRRIVSASGDKTIKLWDVDLSASMATVESHMSDVKQVAFSPDGRRVVSASEDETVKLWDAATGVCVAIFEGHKSCVDWAAFSSDGQRVVSASRDHTVKIWDTATGTCVMTLQGHEDVVRSAVFSTDGRYIVSASFDETVKLWNVQTGKCEMTFEGHTDNVYSATFSVDGRRIVSASFDKTVRIWDVQTGECERILAGRGGHSNDVKSAAFSADGRRVVSASTDGTVKIWTVQTGACEATYAVKDTCNVAFDTTGTLVYTDAGPIRIDEEGMIADSDPRTARPARQQYYGLSPDRVWIQKQSEPVLWLPSEYRPSCSAVTAADGGGSRLALGYTSGYVYIFYFPPV